MIVCLFSWHCRNKDRLTNPLLVAASKKISLSLNGNTMKSLHILFFIMLAVLLSDTAFAAAESNTDHTLKITVQSAAHTPLENVDVTLVRYTYTHIDSHNGPQPFEKIVNTTRTTHTNGAVDFSLDGRLTDFDTYTIKISYKKDDASTPFQETLTQNFPSVSSVIAVTITAPAEWTR